jgi:hypothetical protein
MEIFCSLFMSAGILFQLSRYHAHTEEVPSQFHSALVHCRVQRVCRVSRGPLASVADPDPNPNMQKNFLKKISFLLAS